MFRLVKYNQISFINVISEGLIYFINHVIGSKAKNYLLSIAKNLIAK